MAKKEVRFDIWCKTCRYRFRKETEDPCDNCLSEPANDNSTKPIEYIETDSRRKSK